LYELSCGPGVGFKGTSDADNNQYSEESPMFNKTLACLAFASAPCSALAAQAKVNADPTAFIGFLAVIGLVIAGFGIKIWLNEKKRRENPGRDTEDTQHQG